MRSVPSSPAGEIVEDSEPERERERAAFKAKRRQERRIKKDLELTLQHQREGSQASTRSSGTGEGYSQPGPSSARAHPTAGVEGDGCWSTLPAHGRNERAHHLPSSTSTRLSPTATISAKPIDFSSFAYPRGPLKRSTSSSSSIVTVSATGMAAPTTSAHFAPRPPPTSAIASSTSLEPRRSKSRSVDPLDVPPECPFKDVEMRRIKKCVLCGDDWSAPGKKSRTKWAHMINCTPTTSHSGLLGLIRDYLAITKAGGKQPRSVLEVKMFGVKKEQHNRGISDDMDEPEDAVIAVDGNKLGRGKGRAPSRSASASSSSSRVRRVASIQPIDLDLDDAEPTKSPSPFRSPSPEVAEPSAGAATTSQPMNHFATFAYPGGRSLSRVNSTGEGSGGIRGPPPKDAVPECTIKDTEMRKIKKCLFCDVDWSAPGKKTLVRIKWAHLYAHSLTEDPPLSLPLLTSLLTAHLANPDPEPKTLLESMTMKKAKTKRIKGAKGAVASVVLPSGTDVGREGIMRNVERLVDGDEQEDYEMDDEDEPRPLPSTQAFGTSWLSTRFGERDAEEEDGLSEQDSEGEGASSTGGEEIEDGAEVEPERPRTSLWGLAADMTSTQLSKAGDESISFSHSSDQRVSRPPLAPTQTIISLSSSSSSDSLSLTPNPHPPRTSSRIDLDISASSNESSLSRPLSAQGRSDRSSRPLSGSEDSQRQGREEVSSTSQAREGTRAMRNEMAMGDGMAMEVDRSADDEYSLSERVGRSSIISVEDDDDMEEQHDSTSASAPAGIIAPSSVQQQSNNLLRDPSPACSEYEDISPDLDPPQATFDSQNQISASFFPADYRSSTSTASPASTRPSPVSSAPDFWSTSSPRHQPSHSTPSRPSASTSQQPVIDLSDDDWGDDGNNEGVLQWADSDDVVLMASPPSAIRDRSLREDAPAPLELPPQEVGDEDEDDEGLYDQSDDRWGDDQGVLLWDERVGDLVGEGEGGIAEDEFEDVLDNEEDEVEVEEMPAKKTSAAKGKKKAPPKMPHYEGMTIPELQKHVKAYGTKPSTSKTQLVRVLKEYWDLVYPPTEFPAASSASSPPPIVIPKPKPRKRKAVLYSGESDEPIAIDPPLPRAPKSKSKEKGKAVEVVISDDDHAEGWDSDVPLAVEGKKVAPTKAKPKKKAVVVVDEDDLGVTVVSPDDLPELFRTMIVDNDDQTLWLRVLRYEPIDFLEFVTLVHARGIKCKGWQIALKKWLDGQCITYFTEEQTGPRSRH